jgi:hypothetical protein
MIRKAKGHMIKSLFSCTALLVTLFALPAFAAFNFQEPTNWTVGDPGSTYQNWQASPIAPFDETNSYATNLNTNPTITTPPTMGVQTPGFGPGSGGYYSYIGDYWISANIYNHGGANPLYTSGYSTRVIVQTSASTYPDVDISVFTNMIELVRLDGTPLAGGTNAELVGVTQLFLQETETPFGLANLEELRFEFLLPAYSSDFRVRLQASIHSSFQQLRVDTLLIADQSAIPGDFDGDGDIDGRDFLAWQRGESTIPGSTGDLNDWQTNYGPGQLSAFLVPEPTSLLVVIFGIIMGLNFRVAFGVGLR